jgi:amidophosphoribosyltransferase
VHPCFYGIDTPYKLDLIAANYTVKEIQSYLEADSLAYISLDGLYKAFPNGKKDFCKACFDGQYPVKSDVIETPQLSLFDK